MESKRMRLGNWSTEEKDTHFQLVRERIMLEAVEQRTMEKERNEVDDLTDAACLSSAKERERMTSYEEEMFDLHKKKIEMEMELLQNRKKREEELHLGELDIIKEKKKREEEEQELLKERKKREEELRRGKLELLREKMYWREKNKEIKKQDHYVISFI